MKPQITHGMDLNLCIKCGKGKIRRSSGDRGRLQVWCDVCNRAGRKRADALDIAALDARRRGVEYWWEQSEVYPQMRGKK